MTDDLDRILSREDDLVPSSGFTTTVMDVVRRDATAPPPIPFPWLRAAPGLVAALVAFISLSVYLARATWSSPAAASASTWTASVQRFVTATARPECVWTMVALLIMAASVTMAMRAGQWLRR